jgi:4-oxalocrotonate tautomerase
MPLARISLRRGKPAQYRKAIRDSIYEAMLETFAVPKDDRFMVMTEHGDDEFDYDRGYFSIDRSDDLVIIQLTVSNTRTIEQKKALFRGIVERLGRNPGVSPQDVFINLIEVAMENWSFGNGEAQYAEARP